MARALLAGAAGFHRVIQTDAHSAAVVVVEAPGGVAEVDARPSDALNLAVLSGAPVRVDAAVLSNPEVNRHNDWERYSVRTPDLAAEERQRKAELLARLAQEHEHP